MMKRVVGTTLALALAACGEPPGPVIGSVHDNFGDPVADAKVVVGGRLVATTGADGEFEFSYRAGQRVPLRIEGESIAPAEYGLAIGSQQRAPIEIIVQLMPPEPGLWVVREGDYQPVPTCTLTAEPYDAANTRYFARQEAAAEVYPDELGSITFLDTNEPVGGQGSELAKVATNGVFYRTERTTLAADTVISETIATTDLTPEFQSAGHWFTARLRQGTYVRYDRIVVPPTATPIPDIRGRCYLLRRLYG